MTLSASLGKGALAGAAGTLGLQIAGDVDRASSGNDPVPAPGGLAAAVVRGLGTRAPGRGRGRVLRQRLDAWGALGTAATGLSIGLVGSLLRSAGWRPGPVAGALAAGAASLGVAEGTASWAGAPGPGGTGWVRRTAPHLVFGALTHSALRAGLPDDAPVRRDGPPAHPADLALLVRSLLLGVAAGSRSSLGVASPVLARAVRSSGDGAPSPLAGVDVAQRAEVDLQALAPRRGPRTTTVLTSAGAVVGEMVGDKLPATPSRLSPSGLGARVVTAATGATALCRQHEATSFWPALAGAGGALAGARAGAAWRSAAGRWMPDWQAGLVEDGVALTLAAVAALGGRPHA